MENEFKLDLFEARTLIRDHFDTIKEEAGSVSLLGSNVKGICDGIIIHAQRIKELLDFCGKS